MRLHSMRIGGIEHTPPLTSRSSGLMYAGMVCHRDVRPWLVAVKSIAAMVGEGEFRVIDDGSLTAADRALLSAHLRGLHIVALDDIPTSGYPRGNTWERLLAILDWCRDCYVIQVDADLVVRAALPEVAEAVQANRGFTLAGEPTARLMSLAEASERASGSHSDHIQFAAERQLTDLPSASTYRYMRGCSGFAGFPKGCGRAEAAVLSQFMQQRLGGRWHEWGTEQVTSNFVIANSTDPVVLPWIRYPAFGQVRDIAASALVHFMDRQRYDKGIFTRTSRAAIKRLCQHPVG